MFELLTGGKEPMEDYFREITDERRRISHLNHALYSRDAPREPSAEPGKQERCIYICVCTVYVVIDRIGVVAPQLVLPIPPWHGAELDVHTVGPS